MTEQQFLLDTMVISELSKARPDQSVINWIGAQSSNSLYLSVLTIGEIERGIAKKRRDDPERADRIAEWLKSVTEVFEQRILVVDALISRRWGQLVLDRTPHDVDLLIASTAWVHEMTVVTRNTRHFAPTGVRLFNPYAG